MTACNYVARKKAAIQNAKNATEGIFSFYVLRGDESIEVYRGTEANKCGYWVETWHRRNGPRDERNKNRKIVYEIIED